jgi:hypothetical protein
MERSLVMIVPDPGDCTQGTDNNSDIGNRPDGKDQIWVDCMVPEVVHDLENKPTNTR